jgi:hypothetical protein
VLAGIGVRWGVNAGRARARAPRVARKMGGGTTRALFHSPQISKSAGPACRCAVQHRRATPTGLAGWRHSPAQPHRFWRPPPGCPGVAPSATRPGQPRARCQPTSGTNRPRQGWKVGGRPFAALSAKIFLGGCIAATAQSWFLTPWPNSSIRTNHVRCRPPCDGGQARGR